MVLGIHRRSVSGPSADIRVGRCSSPLNSQRTVSAPYLTDMEGQLYTYIQQKSLYIVYLRNPFTLIRKRQTNQFLKLNKRFKQALYKREYLSDTLAKINRIVSVMQIKITMQYHYILFRIAKPKRLMIPLVVKNVE